MVTVGSERIYDPENPEKWILHLYVAGQSPRSLSAFSNLHKICETHLKGKYMINIVDLQKNPHQGRIDQIFAIPTLVRKLPPPLVKIIGDLSNTTKVLAGLNITPG